MVSYAPRARGSGSTGLSYHTSAYWNARFTTDPREQGGFEWLSPSTSLLSLLTSDPTLLTRTPPIRILHIGVGTSRLSLDLVRYWRQTILGDWKERARRIVNVDFAERSIDFQRRAEQAFLEEIDEEEEGLMKYAVLDLLSWREVQAVMSKGEPFDVVLDKSTTDSISTGDDVSFASLVESTETHPALENLSQRCRSSREGGVATTQVLGIHLGALVKPGAIWLCHSYNADRWDDVLTSSDASTEAAWPWREVRKTPVPVEASDPNAPQIHHYIYTMQRR